MRYNLEHQQRTRGAILEAAGRVFRSEGYGGSGIDALTRAAGVTNGAFYGHFKTKAEAFRSIVGLGLVELRDGIAQLQAVHGDAWLMPFARFYLGQKVACDIGESCALATLSGEVARSDQAARQAYEDEFRGVLDVMATGLAGDTRRAAAILALLSGAATIARALVDPALAAGIVDGALDAVARLGVSEGVAAVDDHLVAPAAMRADSA